VVLATHSCKLSDHNSVITLWLTSTVHYPEHTDNIIVLGEMSIAYQGNTADLRLRGYFKDVTDGKIQAETPEELREQDDTREKKRLEQTEPDEADEYALRRGSGDGSLYLYYLKSIGWLFAVIGLALGVLVAGLEVLSREFITSYP